MGITKTDGFSITTNEMATILKALGHPARISIIKYLSASPSCICNDLVEELPLAQPTISRHLSELKKAGLIQGTVTGKNICYCINQNTWKRVKEYLTEITLTLSQHNYC